MNPIPAQANVRARSVVARADGSPITAGTVNYYLMATTGANAGKWFRTSDDSWQIAESIAGVMTHNGDGHWTVSVDAAAWIDGVEYTEYAKESGDLHVPTSKQIRCKPLEPTATAIVDEWETQSQADPTGFHVNVLEVAGTAQTAADLADILTTVAANWITIFDIDSSGAVGASDRVSWFAALQAMFDWMNGGRLDLILDAIPDSVLARAVQNVEDSADKHSLGAMVMLSTNSSISGTTLTAKKPSDDSTFQTYTVVVSAGADPIIGIS